MKKDSGLTLSVVRGQETLHIKDYLDLFSFFPELDSPDYDNHRDWEMNVAYPVIREAGDSHILIGLAQKRIRSAVLKEGQFLQTSFKCW